MLPCLSMGKAFEIPFLRMPSGDSLPSQGSGHGNELTLKDKVERVDILERLASVTVTVLIHQCQSVKKKAVTLDDHLCLLV